MWKQENDVKRFQHAPGKKLKTFKLPLTRPLFELGPVTVQNDVENNIKKIHLRGLNYENTKIIYFLIFNNILKLWMLKGSFKLKIKLIMIIFK